MTSFIKSIASASIWHQLALIFALCTLLPLLLLGLAVYFVPDLNLGVYEHGKYALPALGFLETGTLSSFDEVTGVYKTSVVRLPLYPLFLAGIFNVFGVSNYLPVLIIQCGMVGLTGVATALAARAICEKWMWPTGLLVAVCPILAFSAVFALPDIQFTMLLAFGYCAILWAFRREKPLPLIIIAGIFFGLAMITRPTMSLFGFVAVPILFLFFWKSRNFDLIRSLTYSLLPFVILGLFLTPHIAKVYKETGVMMFNVQTGTHTLRFLYPCLSAKWGCGQADKFAKEKGARLYKERSADFTDAEKKNPAVVSHLETQIAFELIAELPMERIMTASSGSAIKMRFHNSFYMMMEFFKLPTVYFSKIQGDTFVEQVTGFIHSFLNNPWMMVWLVFQLSLFLIRGVQVVGVVRGLKDPAVRWPMLFLTLTSLTFVAISVGIGNSRYRIPMEPPLLIMATCGIYFLRDIYQKKFKTFSR